MKVINKFKSLCLSCMEEHEIPIVEVEETNIFKGEQIKYLAKYHYCRNSNTFYATEDQISNNDTSMKEEYCKIRRKSDD